MLRNHAKEEYREISKIYKALKDAGYKVSICRSYDGYRVDVYDHGQPVGDFAQHSWVPHADQGFAEVLGFGAPGPLSCIDTERAKELVDRYFADNYVHKNGFQFSKDIDWRQWLHLLKARGVF